MEYIIISLTIIGPLILGLFIHKYFPSYLQEKAKNLATKEDIGKITKEVEEVKNIYKTQFELSKNERDFYTEMIKVTQRFLSELKHYELEHFPGEENKVTKEVIMKTPELKANFLAFIDAATEILAKAFVFLGEESYNRLQKALNKEKTFSAIRLNLFDAMRKSIHPETKLEASKDLWDLKYF